MEYIITTAGVAVFILFILVWSQKTNQRQAERMKTLSAQQLDFIKNSGYSSYQDSCNLMKTTAVLTNVKESNSSVVPVDFIYWNCSTQRYEIGDGKISKHELDNRLLKTGDYINIVFKFKNGYISSFEKIIQDYM